MGPLHHVFVSVDSRAPSLRGLDCAARLAESAGARITLFHAREAPRFDDPPDAPPDELPGLAEALRARGIATQVLVDEAPAGPAILEAVRATAPDLVVLGSRDGQGSVADHVVRRCGTPVVTVHEWSFESRAAAAARLADRAAPLAGDADLTLAITRGAVPIAIEVGRASRTRTATFLVEPVILDGAFAGAVGEDDTVLLDPVFGGADGSHSLRVSDAVEEAQAAARLRARELRPAPMDHLTGRSVLLVADALAAPVEARLAARAARRRGAVRVSLAVPVCAASVLAALPPDVDRTLCLETTRFTPPSARVYLEDDEPTNVDAVAMLVREGARRAREASDRFTSSARDPAPAR